MPNLSIKQLSISPIRRLGYYLGYLTAFIFAVPKVIFTSYDFLVLENPYLTFFSPFAWFRRKKILAEYVDYYPANLRRLYNERRFRYSMAVLICRFFHRYVHYLTAESKTAINTLINLGVPPKKVQIVTVGIDTKTMIFDSDLRKEIRSRIDAEGSDCIVIGYLGKIVKYYNLEVIPQTLIHLKKHFAQIADRACLLVVGEGPYRNELESLCRAIGIRNVVFTGSIPHKDINGYYSAMDLFLFPLDALAIKVAELMAIGTPIVAPPGMAQDWIVDGKTGIIARSNSPEGFAGAILRYLNLSSEEKKLMKRSSQKFCHDELDIRNIARTYLSFFS